MTENSKKNWQISQKETRFESRLGVEVSRNINHTKNWHVKHQTDRKVHQWLLSFFLIEEKNTKEATETLPLACIYRPFYCHIISPSISAFYFLFFCLVVAALSRFGCTTAGAISFWHTLTLFSWRDALAGRREDEKRDGSRMEHFAFFLNEQTPGVTKDIRRRTHPQYIVRTTSVTC